MEMLTVNGYFQSKLEADSLLIHYCKNFYLPFMVSPFNEFFGTYHEALGYLLDRIKLEE
jgi:hypothetical protein